MIPTTHKESKFQRKKHKYESLKGKAPPLARNGALPFKLTLQQLNDIPLDAYIQKTVIIKYWKEFPDIFEGEISCIGSKLQIRLQHINTLYVAEGLLPKKFHHAYWFHFKNIKSIHYQNTDITHEILDIMQYRMAQSFLLYYSNEYSSQFIKLFGNENVSKILNELTKNPSNYKLYLNCHIPQIFEMALKKKTRNIALDIQPFLYDLNRSNKHLLFKRNFRNKQRIVSCFTKDEILQMLRQYKRIVIEHVKQIYGINKTNIKRFENHVQQNFFAEKKTQVDEKNEEDEKEADKPKSKWYIDWDSRDIDRTLKNWKLYTPNKSRSSFYETASWSNAPTIPPRSGRKPPHFHKSKIKKRGGGAKNYGLDNKYISKEKDKNFKKRHNNSKHHGKVFQREKKLHRKRNRINTERDTEIQWDQSKD